MPSPAPRLRTAASAPTREPVAPTGRRVLVADDTRTNVEFLESLLRASGYEVTVARDGYQALAGIAERRPDLVLSDVHMPNMDGFELLAAIRRDKRLRGLPFAMISSSVWGNRERDRALAADADAFISRPIEPESLLERLDSVVRSRAPVA